MHRALIVLLLIVGNASACIWDRETVAHEKQFKSQYLEQSPVPADEPLKYSPHFVPLRMAGWAGAGMLGLAVIAGFVRGRSRAKESQQ